MEAQQFDFDKDVFEEKFEIWRNRFVEGGPWENAVVKNEKKYKFLVDGNRRDVLVYVLTNIKKADYPYSTIWFMLTKEDNKITGYMAVKLMEDSGADVKVADIDTAVLKKGKGVASTMAKIKDVILQKEANSIGDIDELVVDDNSVRIEEVLVKLEKLASANKITRDEYIAELNKMLQDRFRWLGLFGDGGRWGYKQDNDGENLLRRYSKGGLCLEIDGVVENNETNLLEEIGVARGVPIE